MDNHNTERYYREGNIVSVLILVLMDNHNTKKEGLEKNGEPGVLILVLMDNHNT